MKFDTVCSNSLVKKELKIKFTSLRESILKTYSWLTEDMKRLNNFSLRGERYILYNLSVPFYQKCVWKIIDFLILYLIAQKMNVDLCQYRFNNDSKLNTEKKIMGNLVNYVTKLHQSTSRAYIDRMMDDKINCMLKAREYEFDYWDGNRRYGYGGYKYIAGRWKPVAEILIKKYNLSNNSSILDVGCGKGFLLYEIRLLLPRIKISGFDISKHGLAQAKEEIKKDLFIHRAQDKYPFEDKKFDLVISLGCLHSLRIFELKTALKEFERVGKQGYIMLESYRNEKELFNLQCWALTCVSFFDKEEWIWIYKNYGYTGDYEFIYFE